MRYMLREVHCVGGETVKEQRRLCESPSWKLLYDWFYLIISILDRIYTTHHLKQILKQYSMSSCVRN